MGILSWILLGLVAGAIARLVMPGKGPKGILVTIVVGIVGAFLGGYIGTALGLGSVQGIRLPELVLGGRRRRRTAPWLPRAVRPRR